MNIRPNDSGFIGVTAHGLWLRAGAAVLDPRRAGAAARLPQPWLDKVRRRCEPGEAALTSRPTHLSGGE